MTTLLAERVRNDAHGVLTEPTTLEIQRMLPGPIDRVWAYLTDSDLRRQWLAAGDMRPEPGSSFEFVWRNDELTRPPGVRPTGFGDEHRMQSRIVEFRPNQKLVFTWGDDGDVTCELEQRGDKVLLSITHRRITERAALLKVSAGWHAHLDVLSARLEGSEAPPFWDRWSALTHDYDRRFAG